MDALTLGTFLSPILTITTVWNTGETGDINTTLLVGIDKIAQKNLVDPSCDKILPRIKSKLFEKSK